MEMVRENLALASACTPGCMTEEDRALAIK